MMPVRPLGPSGRFSGTGMAGDDLAGGNLGQVQRGRDSEVVPLARRECRA